MGAFINDTTPESVAARLREVAASGRPTTALLTPEGASHERQHARRPAADLADRFAATFGTAPRRRLGRPRAG